MFQLNEVKFRLHSVGIYGVPLMIWLLLWFSIMPGSLNSLLNPANPTQFAQGIRVLFPYLAIISTFLWLAKLFSERNSGNPFFTSPLAFTVAYGLVGVFAAFRSPDILLSLNWVILYLTAPFILWTSIWGPDQLGQIRRIINLNWLIISIATGVFFVIALFSLGLGEAVIKPYDLLRCESSGSWHLISSGMLRSTGIGRFAAITAILAISMSCSGRFRWLWIIVAIGSIALLLNTGARASIVGFAVAAPIVLILLQGRKSVIVGVLFFMILGPLFWGVGIHDTFLRGCILIGTDSSGINYLNMSSPNSIDSTPTLANPSSTDDITLPPPSGTSAAPAIKIPPTIPVTVVSPVIDTQPTSLATPIGPTPYLRLPIPTTVQPPISVNTRAPVTPIADTQTAISETSISPVSDTETTISETSISPVSDTETTISETSVAPVSDAQPTISTNPVTPEIPATDTQQEVTSVSDTPNTSTKPSPELNPKIPEGFFTLTGRTQIWSTGWQFIKMSPALGHGFHGDRLVLGTHMHNAVLHAMIQTGIIGTIPFILAILFAWTLLIKTVRNLNRLAPIHKTLTIQSAGILIFLSIRAIPESTGAFFGIDWLLLSPILLYLRLIYPVSQLETQAQ